MIDQQAVRVSVVDDENGFVETTEQVRRIQGSGLAGLAGRDGPALAPLLAAVGVPSPPPAARPLPSRQLGVLGPDALTRHLMVVLDQLGQLRARVIGHLGPDAPHPGVDLVIAGTASIFDPRVAATNRWCLAHGVPVLFFGLIRSDVAFVGPLWSPDRTGPCFECLRTRIISNSVHGATWRAYLRHLAGTGGRPLAHQATPYLGARLAADVGERLDGWSRAPRSDPADGLAWWEPDAGGPARRHLLPVPDCPACRPSRPVSPLVNLAATVDDRVGIIHRISLRRCEVGPPVHLGGGTSADFGLIRSPLRVTHNGGAGFTAEDATNATIGETLERYAAGFYRPEQLRLAAWHELTEPAVRPDAFGLFSAEQYARPGFPFVPFAGHTPVRWVPARRLDTDQDTLLPASQVFMHYQRGRGEAAIGPSISTGTAAGPTVARATLGGLYEVIERDALAISWLRRIPPRAVPAEVLAASPRLSYHLRRATGWRVSFYDLSLDLPPPVIAAVMEFEAGGERLMSFGAACRWSPVAAAEKAFLEAAQGLPYMRRLLQLYRDWQPRADFADVDDFNKHAVLYTKCPDLRPRAGYLVDPATVPDPRPARPAPPAVDPPGELPAVVDGLAAAGFPSYRVELTTPDVALAGVRVVRVVVPGLQHLAGSHPHRFLGNPRLRTVLPDLGGPPDNPYPHPLP
jgi:bacteriocin biosynthesis cyclodehydratase domain-containing protein